MELYLHFPIRLHGVVLNLLSTGTTLPYSKSLALLVRQWLHWGHCITSSVNEETVILTKAYLKAVYPFISSLARSEQSIKWNLHLGKSLSSTSTPQCFVQIEKDLRKLPSCNYFSIPCETQDQWRNLLVFDVTVPDLSYGGLWRTYSDKYRMTDWKLSLSEVLRTFSCIDVNIQGWSAWCLWNY
jgi:hypothetical protein